MAELNTDSIPLDRYRGLLDFSLATGEQRQLLDGEESFSEETAGIVRIASGDKAARKAAQVAGARPDSMVKLRLPSVDVDSDEVFEIGLWFYTGERPLVLLGGDHPLPRPTLHYVLAVVQSELEDADWDAGRYLDLARDVKNMGLWVLHQRTREIEQSVRDAVDDEEFSSDDYAALREYPARLARVEAAAQKLRAADPEWESARPKESFGINFSPITPDFFHKFVTEAADDAREAVARLSGLISSQQIVLTQRQARETARFQRLVTIVGAAVLVPGLVAAIFGANVGFRGRESAEAFWAMLLLMAGSGVASYALIRSFETPVWKWIGKHKPVVWLMALPDVVRLIAWAVTALVALGIGLALLAQSKSPDTNMDKTGAEPVSGSRPIDTPRETLQGNKRHGVNHRGP